MSLNIGCGDRAIGTVNLDVNRKSSIGLCKHSKLISSRKYNPKTMPNFVRGSSNNLPFRNGCFSKVICSNLLEHLQTPETTIREMIRVSKSEIKLIVPHGIHDKLLAKFDPKTATWIKANHLHFFSMKDLNQLGFSTKFRYKLFSNRKYLKTYIGNMRTVFFNVLLSALLIMPSEIEGTLKK